MTDLRTSEPSKPLVSSASSEALVPLAPLGTKFKLEKQITPEQQAFLDHYGYLHFENVLSLEEVQMVRDEQDRLQAQWIAEKKEKIRGVPLAYGKGLNHEPILHRMPFCSEFSEPLRKLLDDVRFDPIKGLIGENVRVGHIEQDGVVMNRYVNIPGGVHPRLGWHTDGLRDIFYGRMPQRMLNFGLHLDRISAKDGGLRILPCTHLQGFFSMAFKKPYFISHHTDPNELCVETNPGDMTVHDGRLWHRVAQSQVENAERRSLFVPYMTGEPIIKDENSPTALYQVIAKWMRKMKGGK